MSLFGTKIMPRLPQKLKEVLPLCCLREENIDLAYILLDSKRWGNRLAQVKMEMITTFVSSLGDTSDNGLSVCTVTEIARFMSN
jgi:hypothetical protein